MLGRTGTIAGTRYAFTDRYGGVSAPPYDELNLGDHVGDVAASVAENRRRTAGALGLAVGRLAFMAQAHGREVAVVDGPVADGTPLPVADALVTATAGLGLVVLVADCVPVLLATRGSSIVGAVHAGRRGVEAGVVGAAVGTMCRLGARPADLVAVVGPAVCGRCYEVPEQLADQVVGHEPATRATTRTGRPGLDLPAGVVAQLTAAGVGSIEADAGCTVESAALYSHRRDGVTGRFAGVVLS